MSKIERDEEREYRISDEAIVDAHGPEEQALGWYDYFGKKLQFPCDGKCMRERSISPLRIDEIVKVIGMVDEYNCVAEVFVKIEWAGRSFGVPLAQLKEIGVDSKTEEAIADWHYWVDKGHMLCG